MAKRRLLSPIMNEDYDSKLIEAERESSGKNILKFLGQMSSTKLKMIIIMNIMIQLMIVEERITEEWVKLCQGAKYDLNLITNTITEKLHPT